MPSYASNPNRKIGFAIRTSGADPAAMTNAVNGAITSIDPDMQLFDTFAMSERIDRLDSEVRRALQAAILQDGGILDAFPFKPVVHRVT